MGSWIVNGKQLAELSFAELQELSVAVTRRMVEQCEGQRQELAEEFRTRAAQIGVKAEDVLRPAGRKTLEPKYRNPESPEQIWAGRGRRPRWVVEALEAGKVLDDFRIR